MCSAGKRQVRSHYRQGEACLNDWVYSVTPSECEHLYFKAKYLDQILGKTITGVVVKEHAGGSPRSQVFLVFSDGTHYEFYSFDEIFPIKGIRDCGIDWIKSFDEDKIVYQASIESEI